MYDKNMISFENKFKWTKRRWLKKIKIIIVQVICGYRKNYMDDAQMSKIWETLVQLIFPEISVPHFFFKNCRSDSPILVFF